MKTVKRDGIFPWDFELPVQFRIPFSVGHDRDLQWSVLRLKHFDHPIPQVLQHMAP